MKSAIIKRSVTVRGRKTSISLDVPLWEALRRLAEAESIAISALISEIDQERSHGSLSEAVRSFVLNNFHERITAET